MTEQGGIERVAARRPGGKAGAERAAARRLGRATAAADLVGRLLDAPTRRFGFADARLIADWPAIAGAEIARLSLPVRIVRRDRTLVLHVRPTAALLLQHQEPQLLERINAFFGLDVVRRLQLIQAPLPLPPPPATLPPLDAAAEAAIDRAVTGVEPEGLRVALAALGAAIHRRRAAHRSVT